MLIRAHTCTSGVYTTLESSVRFRSQKPQDQWILNLYDAFLPFKNASHMSSDGVTTQTTSLTYFTCTF